VCVCECVCVCVFVFCVRLSPSLSLSLSLSLLSLSLSLSISLPHVYSHLHMLARFKEYVLPVGVNYTHAPHMVCCTVSVLQCVVKTRCVAVCCSVLQRVAVCCGGFETYTSEKMRRAHPTWIMMNVRHMVCCSVDCAAV